MFLRIFLLLCCWLGGIVAQAPARWFTVTAATPTVDATALDYTSDAAARALRTLQDEFPGLPRHRFQIVVHADADSLPPPIRAGHHPGSPGLALLGRHQIHILWHETVSSLTAVDHVVQHEIVHELIDQLVEPHGERVPRWVHEGLAQLLSGETYLGAREEDIVWRVAVDRLLPFSGLDDDFPRRPDELRVAYAQSYSYIAWLDRRLGRQRLLATVAAIDDDMTFDRALVFATKKPTAELVTAWSDYLLHASGAPLRAVMENCFSLLMIFALPLLALAMMRRMQREQRARARLERTTPFDDDAWAGMDDGFYGPPAPPEWHHDQERLR
ncbi:MAG: hypothetical protein IPK26_18895 [Planctomycetes bacterium]|nr:hypothetical protein [Planctomycetota bacterium]